MTRDALFAPVCSIAPTRRRRFLWAAWWTQPPERVPFRKPDAYEGGARTPEEARLEAERAAGRPLVEADGSWARAWARVLIGQPAWPKGADGSTSSSRKLAASTDQRASVWAILGVDRTATLAEIKTAYRKRALETHPDHGGTREAFEAVIHAYESALRRKKRPAGRK